MPIYLYRSTSGGCEHCREGFETLQRMSEEPLERCPQCGAAVEKVPARFGTGGEVLLSDSRLREHGFQKFRRSGEDSYEREV